MKLLIGTHLLLFALCQARIHELTVREDSRQYIPLTSFGYLPRSYLSISLRNFTLLPNVTENLVGFTFEKVQNDVVDGHIETYGEKCILDPKRDQGDMMTKDEIVFFRFDLKNHVYETEKYPRCYEYNNRNVEISCSNDTSVANLLIFGSIDPLLVEDGRDIRYIPTNGSECAKTVRFPLTFENGSYGTQFAVVVPNSDAEGLYNLLFYSCANYKSEGSLETSFVVNIIERNIGSYLSAGDIPLPTVCTLMSIMFFLLAIFWTFTLRESRHPVYKIHYLMDSLVILKALALLFHGINYYFISERGEHVEMWAILYYVTKVFKGAVLFITIILIGTGWTFIKHILSPKDKRIFMIVIPLQVFANVAEIIIEESEEGDVEHRLWMELFTFVDLLCCFAILFPIVWSIKHLQDASQTDGKAAMNLRKLKLFRQFYIMIVCYIYFTRIIVFLLEMTVPFQYTWVHELLRQGAIFVFFVLTGYKFRPASENPYFHVADDDDGEIEVVFSQCGFTEGLSKVNRVINEAGHDDKDSLLVSKRESSYDYD